MVSLDLRLDGNIGEGYNPDLVDRQSGRVWTPRPINTLLSVRVKLTHLKMLNERFYYINSYCVQP